MKKVRGKAVVVRGVQHRSFVRTFLTREFPLVLIERALDLVDGTGRGFYNRLPDKRSERGAYT